ncbi:hypothetical protein HOY80DRAFT_991020 [Tuber brumale]|nr:hypothetical protein HOY80DRAFT_991020 [Tuber brumale]
MRCSGASARLRSWVACGYYSIIPPFFWPLHSYYSSTVATMFLLKPCFGRGGDFCLGIGWGISLRGIYWISLQ